MSLACLYKDSGCKDQNLGFHFMLSTHPTSVGPPPQQKVFIPRLLLVTRFLVCVSVLYAPSLLLPAQSTERSLPASRASYPLHARCPCASFNNVQHSAGNPWSSINLPVSHLLLIVDMYKDEERWLVGKDHQAGQCKHDAIK